MVTKAMARTATISTSLKPFLARNRGPRDRPPRMRGGATSAGRVGISPAPLQKGRWRPSDDRATTGEAEAATNRDDGTWSADLQSIPYQSQDRFEPDRFDPDITLSIPPASTRRYADRRRPTPVLTHEWIDHGSPIQNQEQPDADHREDDPRLRRPSQFHQRPGVPSSELDLRRTGRGGSRLKARCEGSSGGPYHVEATVAGPKIVGAECTCPVGVFCKHIVALLLAWKDHPETFTEVESLDTVLQGKSKAELVALVKQLVAPRAGPGNSAGETRPEVQGRQAQGAAITAETYERQTAAVFRRHSGGFDEYGDSDSGSQCAEELQPILSTGDEFLKDKDFAAAVAVFEGVLNAFIDHYDEEFQDEEGSLNEVIDHCVEQLGRCLDGLKNDPVRREAILRMLYEVDTEVDGLDLAEEPRSLLVEKTEPAERQVVANWVRADLAKTTGSGWGDKYRRRSYGELLLDLEADQLDDEAYLKICRETGRALDLIGRLHERKRLDEAIEEARSWTNTDLLQAASLFLRHRQVKVIEDLVRERAEKSQDRRLLEWLKDRAVRRKDWSTALGWTEAMFRKQPSLADYEMVRTIAKKLKSWSSLRPQLLEFLATKHDIRLIIEIHLDEGEIDQALQRLKGYREPAYFGDSTRLAVARAAEKARPQAALEIYRNHAVDLIESQGRRNYHDACKYLKKVHGLYDTLGKSADWTKEADRLREKYNRFPAFLDELKKARL